MRYLRKHQGFVTLGIVILCAALATLAMLGAVTGFAVFSGSILGGAVSLGVSDIRANRSDDFDMRES